jgi:hypothetical protein
VVIVVALLGYLFLSGQLSAGQLVEDLLGGGGGGTPTAVQSTPSAEAA